MIVAKRLAGMGGPAMPQTIIGPLRRWDPERIGSYTILGRLGAGAMGQVFLARSTAGRLVAVKTIRIELAEEADFRARFARASTLLPSFKLTRARFTSAKSFCGVIS